MTVRLEGPLGEIVLKLAKNDDRSIGYVLRQLIVEALQTRKLVPTDKVAMYVDPKHVGTLKLFEQSIKATDKLTKDNMGLPSKKKKSVVT